jgi:hypothetical protein
MGDMQITEEGRRVASGFEFATQLVKLTRSLHSIGTSEQEGTSIILCLTACVHADTPPPDWLIDVRSFSELSPADLSELRELTAFVGEHATEIDETVGRALQMVAAAESGGDA